MAHDKTEPGLLDPSHVNITDGREVRYWCKAFGCTEQELRRAVNAVGTSAEKVRRLVTAFLRR